MKVNNLLWGLVFIVIGVVLGLNALEITNINIFFDGWWTLVIIIPCFIDLFKNEEKTGNIIGLVIGVSLLLACNDFFDFEIIWKLFVPFILVMIGISFVCKDTISSKIKRDIKKLNKSDNEEYWATFGGQTVDFTNEEFKGCNLTAVFGGVKCNLQKAIIKEDCVINVSSIFGGVTICASDNVKIKVISTPIFGGVSNNRKTNDGKVTLYVRATCLFGGVILSE